MNKFLILSSLLFLNLSCAASDSKSEPLLRSYAGSRIDTSTFYRDGQKCTAMAYYSGLVSLPVTRIINGKYTLNSMPVSEKEYNAVIAIKDLRKAQEEISAAENTSHGKLAAQEHYRLALQKVGDGMEESACCCIQ